MHRNTLIHDEALETMKSAGLQNLGTGFFTSTLWDLVLSLRHSGYPLNT